MILNSNELSPEKTYDILTQVVIPRPIAWTYTQSTDFINNLAPFSYFSIISSDPPLIAISCDSKKTSKLKDTANNILATKKAVIHIASQNSIIQLNQSSASLSPDQDEIEISKLNLVTFDDFELKRLENAPIALGCRMYEKLTIGNKPNTLIILKIERIFIKDEIIKSNDMADICVDSGVLDPLAKLGKHFFSGIGDLIEIERPH